MRDTVFHRPTQRGMEMSQKSDKALEKVRDALHDAVAPLGREDYRDVLERLEDEARSRLEELDEETSAEGTGDDLGDDE